MTISSRLEKLRFIVDELQIALFLARQAPDAATARMLARHVLVRAFDFIDHARTLRRPLREAGHNTATFHKLKETFADDFDAYFVKARHRFSAHVQDLPLEERLALWNDIEILKVDYFVDGAREIYSHLGDLGIVGFTPYVPPAELSDVGLASSLQAMRDGQRAASGPEFASDALALTRPNTVSMLNLTPVHERAGQIALLRRWIRTQRAMLDILAAFPRVQRLLTARLMTDIVSFADCLITRPTAPDAPQAQLGLDDLIRDGGQSAEPIEAFLTAFDFEAALGPLRSLRNQVGGHLEGDQATPLATLTANLDVFHTRDALAFFDRMEAAFLNACRGVIYLTTYIGDGERVRGVTGLEPREGRIPFDAARPEVDLSYPQPTFDNPTFDRQLAAWRGEDADARADAASYFYQASLHAPVIRTITREERIGSSIRPHDISFRSVNVWMVDTLSCAPDDVTVGALVDLLILNARGDPAALTEVLLAYAVTGSLLHRPAVIHGLGQTAPAWHEPAHDYLQSEVASGNPTLGFWARAALMRIFVRGELSARANKQGQPRDWVPEQAVLLTHLSPSDQLLMQLILLSQFWDDELAGFARWFEPEIEQLQSAALTGLETIGDAATWSERKPVAEHLVRNIDVAGIAVLLFTELAPNDETGFNDALLWAVCHGPVPCARDDDATRHLVLCYDKIGASEIALQVIAQLATRRPASVDYQLLKLELSADGEADPRVIREQLAFLRKHYRLDQAAQARADNLEQRLAGADDRR